MTFEHLEDLPRITEKCRELLKKNGTLQIAIPCEGELAFKLGWKLTTGLVLEQNMVRLFKNNES